MHFVRSKVQYASRVQKFNAPRAFKSSILILSILHSSFFIRHSSFVLRHFIFHSYFVISFFNLHSSIVNRQS